VVPMTVFEKLLQSSRRRSRVQGQRLRRLAGRVRRQPARIIPEGQRVAKSRSSIEILAPGLPPVQLLIIYDWWTNRTWLTEISVLFGTPYAHDLLRSPESRVPKEMRFCASSPKFTRSLIGMETTPKTRFARTVIPFYAVKQQRGTPCVSYF